MAAKKTDLMDEIEKNITKLMKETMNSSETSLTDKAKVIDRALKLAQIKAKIDDDGDTGGFED